MFRHALKQSETYSRARRNRLSAEIREKYKDDPEAVIHAAMMLVGQQNVNAQKVHKHILDDVSVGDVFMEAYEKRNVEPAKKMPTLTALGYVLNQVQVFFYCVFLQ